LPTVVPPARRCRISSPSRQHPHGPLPPRPRPRPPQRRATCCRNCPSRLPLPRDPCLRRSPLHRRRYRPTSTR
jgi:hypothetical protein